MRADSTTKQIPSFFDADVHISLHLLYCCGIDQRSDVGSRPSSIAELQCSYPIDKLTEGYYLLVESAADPADIRELDRVLSLADEVIRFKTVVLPEKLAKQPAAAPEAVSPVEAPSAEAV